MSTYHDTVKGAEIAIAGMVGTLSYGAGYRMIGLFFFHFANTILDLISGIVRIPHEQYCHRNRKLCTATSDALYILNGCTGLRPSLSF